MATDKTEPKVGLIMKIGVFAIVAVIGVRIGLVSYYRSMVDEEQGRKYAMQKPERLEKVRADEAKALAAIDQSMKALAAAKRPEAIEPKQSNDLAPMEGWRLMPQPLPEAGAPAPAPHQGAADDGGTGATGDAGAATTGDAGAATTGDAGLAAASTDAGAAKKPEEKKPEEKKPEEKKPQPQPHGEQPKPN